MDNKPKEEYTGTPLEKQARSELHKLEEQKNKSLEAAKGKGFIDRVRLGLGRANINKEINQRRQFLSGQQAVRNLKTKVEIEKAKSELTNFQKANVISYDSIVGIKTNPNVKQVKFEDLF